MVAILTTNTVSHKAVAKCATDNIVAKFGRYLKFFFCSEKRADGQIRVNMSINDKVLIDYCH